MPRINLLLIMFLSSLSFAGNPNPYLIRPILTWTMEITDSHTGECIEGVQVESETYYEYAKCQHPQSPEIKMKLMRKRLDNKMIPTNELEDFFNDFQKTVAEYHKLKKQNNTPTRDTFIVNTASERWRIGNPVRRYHLKLSHPEYDPIEISEKFEICQMSILVKTSMNPKKLIENKQSPQARVSLN